MAFSSEFTGEAVHLLMDILNDDSLVVQLQALETLHHISLCGQLTVEESHLHMVKAWLIFKDIISSLEIIYHFLDMHFYPDFWIQNVLCSVIFWSTLHDQFSYFSFRSDLLVYFSSLAV